jgi:hypothetical protein
MRKMKKVLLTGIAVLFLATGIVHAQPRTDGGDSTVPPQSRYRGPTTANDPLYNRNPNEDDMFNHFGQMAEGLKTTVIVVVLGTFGLGIVLGSAIGAFNVIRWKRKP